MAAPELRLNVSLDLGFFRQQLQKLTVVAQSEFAPKLNVKFNRSTLDKELNNLQSAIKRRTYRVEIGGNIDQLPNKIKSLKEQLASLESFKIDLGVGAVKSLSKKDASKIKNDLRAEVLGEQKKIYVPLSIKPVITRQDVRDFKNAVQSKLTGLTVKVRADLQAASISGGAKNQSDIDADVRRGLQAISEIGAARMAKGAGGVTEAARREQLKQSLTQGGLGIEELQKVGKQLGVGGVGRFRKTSNLIEKIVADASVEMIKAYLDPQAVMRNSDKSGIGKVLDTFARGVFSMLGMDPASIRAQQAERRRIPDINFEPTIPPRSFPIGPSSTGRALPPGAIAKGLPGTAFGAQKYLPTALGEELKQILRGAANAFVDSVKQNIRAVKITDLGAPVSRQGLLGGRAPAGLLPAGVGRAPGIYSTGRLGREGETREQLFTRREREARMRSALRGVDIMGAGPSRTPAPYSQSYRAARPTGAIVPYAAAGALVAQGGGAPPGRGTGGPFGGRPGGAGGMQFNMPNLPGAGIVRELGQEFGFAAKQVLLFGTAYRALAFIQNFPAQVGEAVGALQSFRNTIGEISPTAKEAGQSSQFILDIVDKYNVPLQSARDGFVKLYASMQPAGFSGDEIRDLFLGISQTAATFGMSADKVDRVNYAFAQMASKGQVMSEELKGQLGDVLPGAMAIFAEAAGFKGPEAITKFSAALEDGAYKGAAMKTLLTNVGIVMRKEFGPGAEGAARTFQGVMSRMQNSTKLLYESFEPVAVGFLNSVVMPMTNGIKTITDGFNAFFTGTAAKTAGGLVLAGELEKLKPSFEGIAQNIKQLLPLFQTFGNILLNVGQIFVAIAGNPITGFLLKVYTSVILVNGVFTLLGGKVLVSLIASVSTAIGRFIALNLSVATLQRTSAATNSTLAGTQLQMALLSRNATSATGPLILLRNTLFSIASFGVIAVAVTIAVSGLQETMAANAELAKLRDRRNAGGAAAILQGATKEEVARQKASASKTITNEKKKLQQLNTPVSRVLQQLNVGGVLRPLGVQTVVGASEQRQLARARIESAKAIMGVSTEGRTSEVASMSGVMGTIPGTEGDKLSTKKGAKEKKERESQIPQLTLQLEKTRELSGIEMQIVNAQLMNNVSQLNSLELLKKLVEFKYEAKALGLEDLTTEERSLKMKEIGLRREQSILESQLQLQMNLNKERDEIQKGFETVLEGYQEEASFQQRYLDLIDQGILPSMAKAQAEGEKAFAQAEKKLDQSMEQIEANIAGLETTIEALKLEGKLTKEKQEQLDNDENNLKVLKESLRLRGLLKDTAPAGRALAVTAEQKKLAPKTAQEYIGEGLETVTNNLQQLLNTGYQVVQAANAIGDAFGTAFKGIVTGSMTAQEAFAGMFQSIADHFADMVAEIIAEYLKMQLIEGIKKIFKMFAPAVGGGGVSTGFGSGFDQYGGGNFGAGGDVTGFFGANGGVASGGWQPFPVTAFANGGMVSGPTLGLVGEGRYNEAIIPLPDGKSVPVQLSGAAGGNAAPINTSIVVNVKNGQADSQMSGNQGNQLARELEGAVRQVILKESRPGGLIASSR